MDARPGVAPRPALGTSDQFWMNLSRDDFDIAVEQHRDEFDQIKPWLSA
jgi:plasmid maintenance system antidote protein VapI